MRRKIVTEKERRCGQIGELTVFRGKKANQPTNIVDVFRMKETCDAVLTLGCY